MRSSKLGLGAATAAAMLMAGFASVGALITDRSQGTELRGSNGASSDNSVQKNSPSKQAQRNRLADAFFGRGMYFPRGLRRPTGTGWPVATDRRRAKKAKRVARNRKAHR